MKSYLVSIVIRLSMLLTVSKRNANHHLFD